MGAIDGFSSAVMYFPRAGVAVGVCTSANRLHKNELLNGVLAAWFDGEVR